MKDMKEWLRGNRKNNINGGPDEHAPTSKPATTRNFPGGACLHYPIDPVSVRRGGRHGVLWEIVPKLFL
jgi:hypothetical protein